MTAIYARQSIERQDSVSIEAQSDQCLKYVDGDHKIYFDKGYSGKDIKRPQFEQMIADIKAGKIDAVISYRLDRVSRSITDFANLLQLFEKYNVKYISATEQFDTSSPMGRAMIYIVMVFAQLERETIAGRIQDNYRFRSQKGLYMGGNTAFGYSSKKTKVDGKTASVLIPDANSETLIRIFNEYVAGMSMSQIAKRLNMQGIRTAKNALWTPNRIKRILTNITPVKSDLNIYHYLDHADYQISNEKSDFDGSHGMCIFFKTKNRNQETSIESQVAVIGLHEPLISSETFIKTQELLSSNIVTTKKSKRTYLAGLVKCGECGRTFGIKYTVKDEIEYIYYHCRGRHSHGLCSNKVYIKSTDLENIIIERSIEHVKAFQKKDQSELVIADTSKADNLKKQIDNLINNIGLGNITVDDLLSSKINTLKKQLRVEEQKLLKHNTSHIKEDELKSIVNKLDSFSSLTIEEKNVVISAVIDKVIIEENGCVAIDYKF